MRKGFTLIELMVSISIFLVVMTISMGAIFSIFDANRKSESLKVVMNNLNLAVDSMSREIKFGSNYHCGAGGNIKTPQDCAAGDTYISFLSNQGLQEIYTINGTSIEKSTDGGRTFLAVTAPEIDIEHLDFYVVGSLKGDGLQPKVLIMVKGYSGGKPDTKTEFAIQTLVSQRAPDN